MSEIDWSRAEISKRTKDTLRIYTDEGELVLPLEILLEQDYCGYNDIFEAIVCEASNFEVIGGLLICEKDLII